ncbi:bifunctional diguanylate cyclase/phosphodiesterase [uncultured Ruminococcus sp.]|uniref:putative bifunctional diguanylate cyclase/phosphodiesterase n=1 Tax=uncultured Ruminococcus sp. TaxID=165186 RepID=UPI0025F0EA8C|nr:bifunctional diguanylate cyclase/phosphodiesterase [uncultured Ruminococcus sp.]
MDLRSFVENFSSPTCIVSVEKTENGGSRDIRIAECNQAFRDMLALQAADSGKSAVFVPNSPYYLYFPKNNNFEDVCLRAAIQKTEVHTYAHINEPDLWFDIYAMPVNCEDGNTCYCTYTSTPSRSADSILDAMNNAQTSGDVLKTCIKLHKAESIKGAMESVISDIRVICDAESCTVLQLNDDEEKYTILATDFKPDSTMKSVITFDNFYEIALSWKDMLGDVMDCIIIRNKEELEHIHSINEPWYKTLIEAGVKSVVLFPLRQGKEILGFIWATNFDTAKTMRIKETLELTTFFISTHIVRYKAMKRLHNMSYTDVLTGLPNRFACTDILNGLIQMEEKFAVVSVNLNNFKSINNTLGFEAGNKAILGVAERWKVIAESEESRSREWVTHLSGDEFMIIITGCTTDEEIVKAISRYVDALSEHFTVDGCDIYISASFGYAAYTSDSDTPDTLTSHANAAMNKIKKAHNSEHILRFTPDILKNEHTLEIESIIRSALESDTIFYNLQPQFDMQHKLRGFEALARMKDSEGNFISPGEFIPVAEKVGLIDRVDSVVFKKAAWFFGEVLRKTGADLILSLNASARHLMKNDFIDEIRGLLADSGIPAKNLEIEITESIMIDVEKALGCIDDIKSLGVKMAIDDFGTGYSSLSYLNRFHANLLKVDKSFIDKMNTNDSSRQYVAAIISIGHIMGFDVISEGVEEPEQLETLRSIGCDYIQGYIWGRPLLPEAAEELIKEELL